MVSRKSQHGVFWGCKSFPQCKGTRNVDGDPRRKSSFDADRERPDFDVMPSQRQRGNDRRRW